MTTSDFIAALALIVSSGALFLEVRRWVESGPKLVVKVAPDMVMIDGYGGPEKALVMVSVYNRGSAPTTIATLAVMEYTSLWHRLRGRTVGNRAYLIPNPSADLSRPGLPAELAPNAVWKGFISKERDDVIQGLTSGRFFAVVSATHRDRPFHARIPESK